MLTDHQYAKAYWHLTGALGSLCKESPELPLVKRVEAALVDAEAFGADVEPGKDLCIGIVSYGQANQPKTLALLLDFLPKPNKVVVAGSYSFVYFKELYDPNDLIKGLKASFSTSGLSYINMWQEVL